MSKQRILLIVEFGVIKSQSDVLYESPNVLCEKYEPKIG